MNHQSLSVQFRPRSLIMTSPASIRYIEESFEELRYKALNDANACCGYFPAISRTPAIDHDLPACQQLAETMPAVEIDGKPLHFNFMRLSLIRQRGQSPFHLDSDANTALTGAVSTLHQRLVWRLLLNLSANNSRRLCFLNVEPSSVRLGVAGGYVYSRERVPPVMIETAILHPREGRRLHGVLFAANRVLHTGSDDESGHFIIAFGREDRAPRPLRVLRRAL